MNGGNALRATAGARLLVVDDDAATLEALDLGLSSEGFGVETCRSAEAALVAVRERDFDLVLTDVQMQGTSGLELCRELANARSDLPVIVMTGHASMRTAVRALRSGAYDYLVKPIDLAELEAHVRRAIDHAHLSREVLRLRRAHRADADGVELIGESDAMRDLRDLVHRVATTTVSVLLTGESGTGKEVAARVIHGLSSRSDGPFVAINCAALTASLLESELFGHVKGAFTDARRARRGLFLEADGGTLLLDEIGELPLLMQAKLLRALQERKVRPVGGDASVAIDTRVIAATNRDLLGEIEAGGFREDLYYRLNVVQIDLPPLRARGNDILLLAQRFLERFAERQGVPVKGLSAEAATRLLGYDWPGNVRELMNAIERGVALARFDELQAVDLPERIRSADRRRLDFAEADPEGFVSLAELQRRYVLRVLDATGGNKSHAARILGIDRKTLLRKIRDDA